MADVQLPDFEGESVRKAKLKVTKSGDGLSEALSLGPKAWHIGDVVYIVLKTEITDVNHKAEKDTKDRVRIHTAAAVEAIEVDAGDVADLLASERERIRVARDAAAGQDQLPIDVPKPKRKPVADPGPGVKAGVRVVDDEALDTEGAIADGSRFDSSDLPLVGAGVTTPDGEE